MNKHKTLKLTHTHTLTRTHTHTHMTLTVKNVKNPQEIKNGSFVSASLSRGVPRG